MLDGRGMCMSPKQADCAGRHTAVLTTRNMQARRTEANYNRCILVYYSELTTILTTSSIYNSLLVERKRLDDDSGHGVYTRRALTSQ